MEAQLRLQLRGIEEGLSRHEAEVPAADLDLAGSEEVEYLGPVRVDLELDRSGDQVQVRGGVRVSVRQRCVRCLQPVETLVSGEVALVGRKPAGEEKGADPPEGMVYHDGDWLDLAGEVREVVLLETPTYPLCRSDCAGLCPHCGADRNLGPCGCGAERPVDPRLAALEALRRPPSDTKDRTS